MAKPIRAFFRLLLLAGTAVTVAGCFETTAGIGGSPGGLSTAALDTPGSVPRQAAQAGRGTRAPTITEPAPPPEYLTLEKAKGDCWMQAETDKKAPKALDARGKWVEKCAAAKMREQATQWASPTAQSTSTTPQPTGLSFSPTFAAPTGPSPPPEGVGDSVMQKGM